MMKKLAAVLALFTIALAAALPARAGFYFPDEGGFDTGYNLGGRALLSISLI